MGGQARLGAGIIGRSLGCGQAVRRLTLDQETEGSNPSAPANSTTWGFVRRSLLAPTAPLIARCYGMVFEKELSNLKALMDQGER